MHIEGLSPVPGVSFKNISAARHTDTRSNPPFLTSPIPSPLVVCKICNGKFVMENSAWRQEHEQEGRSCSPPPPGRCSQWDRGRGRKTRIFRASLVACRTNFLVDSLCVSLHFIKTNGQSGPDPLLSRPRRPRTRLVGGTNSSSSSSSSIAPRSWVGRPSAAWPGTAPRSCRTRPNRTTSSTATTNGGD